MFNEIIELVKKEYITDNLGQQIPLTKSREVFAKRKSIKQSEYYIGGQIGLKADKVFVIRTIEYDDETQVKYKGIMYDIYRTYVTDGEFIELYICDKLGT